VTSLLHWRGFEKAKDRDALRAFVCTDPEKKTWDGRRRHHPREWELDVQSSVREHSPNVNNGEVFILGFEDDSSVGAVSAWSRYAGEPGRVLLQLIAVSVQRRGCGRAWANEAMAKTLEQVTADAREADAERLLLEARIHRNNRASKRMCEAHGFIFDSMHTNNLELWAYYQPL
jgi:RimJ/RimL family protein N-acetyltransferase